MWDKLRDERGFVLILVIMLLAAMTAIGTAALMTSNTDMLIARNEKQSKIAFYLAETGLEETLGRMDLGNGDDRFIGETQAQRTVREGGGNSFDNQTNSHFNSTDERNPLNLSNIGGTYSVTVTYAKEGNDTWCDNDDLDPDTECNNEIVMYGTDFGFIGTGVPTTGYVPVYQIDSVGTTTAGTTAKVRAYVTASTLNVVPPAGDLYTVSGTIDGNGSNSIIGNVAVNEDEYPMEAGDCGVGCTNVSSDWVTAEMQTYLGMDLDELASHADYLNIQDGNETYTNPDWGTPCDPDDTTTVSRHICDNDAKIVFIDNDDPLSNARVAAGTVGRGILIVTGDLFLSGNLLWEGMIYVMGQIQGNGSVTCFGTIMTNGAQNYSGNISVLGSVEVAQSAADMLGMSRMLRWTRL